MAYNPFRNFGLKLLALLVAAALWFTVAGEHTVERSVRVPLEFRNIPDGLELVGDPPATVDVRLRGSSGQLSRLGPGEIIVVLDLKNTRAGMRLFHIQNEQVIRPYGIDVTQVQPPAMSLDLERTATRTVPVRPAIEGQPARGFVIAKIDVVPPTVEIVGPQDQVRGVDEATTEPISIAGARGPVHDTVAVGLTQTSVRLKQPQPARVTVDIVPAENR